jgi:hypothetical protein
LITAVPVGTSQYIVTNTSDIYYVEFAANTTSGWQNYSTAVDYRSGAALDSIYWGKVSNLNYGSYSTPDWVKNNGAIVLIILLSGGFGAIYAPLGAIVDVIMTLLFAHWGWLTNIGAGIGFIGGLAVLFVLYFIQDKEYKF